MKIFFFPESAFARPRAFAKPRAWLLFPLRHPPITNVVVLFILYLSFIKPEQGRWLNLDKPKQKPKKFSDSLAKTTRESELKS